MLLDTCMCTNCLKRGLVPPAAVITECNTRSAAMNLHLHSTSKIISTLLKINFLFCLENVA